MAAVSVCGRTFLELYPAMKERTLPTFLEQWSKGMFLSLQTDGATQASASHGGGTESSNGAFWTLNTWEFPRDAAASSLWSILEHGGVDPRFYLSRKACRGILSRARRHHKELPDVLMKALTRIAEGSSEISSERPSPREKELKMNDPEDG